MKRFFRPQHCTGFMTPGGEMHATYKEAAFATLVEALKPVADGLVARGFVHHTTMARLVLENREQILDALGITLEVPE